MSTIRSHAHHILPKHSHNGQEGAMIASISQKKMEIAFRVLLSAMILINALAFSPMTAKTASQLDSDKSAGLVDEHFIRNSVLAFPTFAKPESRVGERDSELTSLDSAISPQINSTSQPNTGSSILFIENVGQFDPKVRFIAQTKDATIFFTESTIWLVILEPPIDDEEDNDPYGRRGWDKLLQGETQRKGVNLKLNFVGSCSSCQIEPVGKIDTSISYFAGSDSEAQFATVPVWSEIRYKDLYPGMDLEISAEGDQLSWNFVIADSIRFYQNKDQSHAQEIRIQLAGHKKLEINQEKL